MTSVPVMARAGSIAALSGKAVAFGCTRDAASGDDGGE